MNRITICLLVCMTIFFSCKTKKVITQDVNSEVKKEKAQIVQKEYTGKIHKVVPQMPSFPGCSFKLERREFSICSQQKFSEYTAGNLKNSESKTEDKRLIMVVVSFVIEVDGYLSNIKVINPKGGWIDKEAVRFIESMNEKGIRWNPGKIRDEYVRVAFNHPLQFYN